MSKLTFDPPPPPPKPPPPARSLGRDYRFPVTVAVIGRDSGFVGVRRTVDDRPFIRSASGFVLFGFVFTRKSSSPLSLSSPVGADNATMAFRCTLASTPVSSLWREGEGDAE